MTKEETRAVTFVGALLVLALVARFVTKPKPIMITAGSVDIAALRAAGEALADRPPGKGKGRKRSAPVPSRPPGPLREWSEPAWRRPRAATANWGDGPKAAKVTGPIDLNRASAEELDRLPGVGPAVAKRIAARRDSVGRFQKVEDLDAIRGIGPALIEKLRGKVVLR